MQLNDIFSIITIIFLIINFGYLMFRNNNKDLFEKIDKLNNCLENTNKEVNEMKVEFAGLKACLNAVIDENKYLKTVINNFIGTKK